jgi:NTE family protein
VGQYRQPLPGPVAPGQEATFPFTVSAPPPPGALFQWRALQEGVEWFGAISPGIQVSVAEPAECAVLRQQIADLEAEISALRAALDGLDPKNPVDRAEIRRINQAIAQAERDLTGLRGRSDQHGCA